MVTVAATAEEGMSLLSKRSMDLVGLIGLVGLGARLLRRRGDGVIDKLFCFCLCFLSSEAAGTVHTDASNSFW